ncbi:RNA polymerase sigma-70 factor [Paraflavitalea sp. CAU 1676]|uniref:RNA polymerase sigma-70 factor n=1 Tax=Paraflavitalea sp. CAU 1676 TaxID=3032598 RepID=UPI0023D9D259|nr:RNA polymerase sigma-70 factor [Paraflavitalea sp. CAU 1676]MDF2192124.1 RNA polymerase sigma-70 factor [Paraflavitalea sp. CAU 1676]
MILTWQPQNTASGVCNTIKAYTPVEAHYQQCFHAYFEKLFGYAWSIVNDEAEAKDIVQTAFLKLWEKRSDINVHGATRAYLYTTVYHLSLNTVRNRKARDQHQAGIAARYVSPPVQTAEDKELRERIHQAIDTLPPRCREVFCKSRLEGKKYAAIAEELTISIKTVEVQMGKALRLLREQLADLVILYIVSLFTGAI